MAQENKHRLKALILLMRWTGLRLSDAVRVTVAMISGDVPPLASDPDVQ